MTVAELIEKLQAMPQDAVVVVPHEFAAYGWVLADTAVGMRGKLEPGGAGEVCTDEPLNRRYFDRAPDEPVQICAIS